MTITAIVAGMNQLLSPFANVEADDLNVIWQTATVAGEKFTCTGREILLVRSDSGTNTVTITSVDDPKGRQENLATYEIAEGEIAAWCGGLTNAKGWQQTDKTILVTASATDISFAVLRLPAAFP